MPKILVPAKVACEGKGLDSDSQFKGRFFIYRLIEDKKKPEGSRMQYLHADGAWKDKIVSPEKGYFPTEKAADAILEKCK